MPPPSITLHVLPYTGDILENPVAKDFFKLRREAFAHYGVTHYRDRPFRLECHPDVVFIVATDQDQNVLGGRRVSIKRPGSDLRFGVEVANEFKVSDAFHHLPLQSCVCAEIGGFFKRLGSPKGCGVPQAVQQKTKEVLEANKVDFYLGQPLKTNLETTIRNAESFGAKQIVFRDDLSRIGQSEGEDPLHIIAASFHEEKEFPLCPPGMAIKQCQINGAIARSIKTVENPGRTTP
jgi:hypothetical protein